MAELRNGIARVGEPFKYLFEQAELPREDAEAGGQAVLAERALPGNRAAVEATSSTATPSSTACWTR